MIVIFSHFTYGNSLFYSILYAFRTGGDELLCVWMICFNILYFNTFLIFCFGFKFFKTGSMLLFSKITPYQK